MDWIGVGRLMTKHILWLMTGILLGLILNTPIKAQNANLIYGIFSGAPKVLQADTNGNLKIQLN